MRWLLLSFIPALLFGRELGMTARGSVDRRLLTLTGWEVQESSNASLAASGNYQDARGIRRLIVVNQLRQVIGCGNLVIE